MNHETINNLLLQLDSLESEFLRSAEQARRLAQNAANARDDSIVSLYRYESARDTAVANAYREAAILLRTAARM